MEITASLVKQLRDRTSAGMMECKAALVEAKGDLAEAEVVLRKKGIASAGKKATRATKQGVIGTYIHPGSQLGVLIEVNCESDFVARTDDFQELVRDIAMQVAAADPKWVRREEVPADAIETLPDELDNTAQEADAIATWARERHWTRLIVITDRASTRRAGFAMRRVLGSDTKVIMRGPRIDPFAPDAWWRSRRDVRAVLYETPKLLAYWCGLRG